MTTQQQAVSAARDYRAANAPAILRTLAELVALPNVSRDLAAVRRNATAVRSAFADRGVTLDLVEIDGAAPVLTGRISAPRSDRRIGIYVHYDGQPADPAQWRSQPFEPTLYTADAERGGRPRPLPADDEEVDPEWRLYARAVADDKAPLVALLAAIDALQLAGIEPTREVILLFEGEEEIGSPHLSAYLRQLRDRLEAEAWLVCDGPVHQTRRPQVIFGVRGLAGLELTVYGPLHELHSGHYGNWAPNPAQQLARLLASMKDDDGTVLVEGFYDSTIAAGETEQAALEQLPPVDDELRESLGLAATEADNALLAERLLLPSLNVRGLAAGSVGPATRNVIPATARASIDIRLAAGNDPQATLGLVEDHIRRQGFLVIVDDPDAETRRAHPRIVKVTHEAGYPAVRTPADVPIAADVLAAAEAAAGETVISLPTLGGSVPLHSFSEVLGVPLLVVPMANHDNNQHAANENLRLANLWYGIDLMAALLTMP
ncbi:MAG: M20/M25/M40 family metallo-hydrolase [Actinomycetota bacterium]|nr:M20/M25/M40 family metallo-hydrolase [Actinomycetota bacterium]